MREDVGPHPETTTGVRVARWLAAVLMIAYGFAKLTGSQFTVLDSELSKPMGEVSGFWLTWYYFGSSTVYGTVIALVEIGGGLLLAWPRTALVGALVLLPVVGNIILMDVVFGIGALPASVTILICLLIVVRPHARRLAEAALLDFEPSRRAVAVRGAVGRGRARRSVGIHLLARQPQQSQPDAHRWRLGGRARRRASGAGVLRVQSRRDGRLPIRGRRCGPPLRGRRRRPGAGLTGVEGKGPLIYVGETVNPGRIELRASGDGSRIVLVRE